MDRCLHLMEIQETNNSKDKFWFHPQPRSFKSLLVGPCHSRNWGPVRDEKTFKKHLLTLTEQASSYYNCKKLDAYDILLNFLFHISRYNGFVYGGLVRDFLVPVLIYGQHINGVVDFKDIDIWFSKESEANEFIESLSGDNEFPRLVPDQSGPKYQLEEYGCGQPFTRKKFYFCFDWGASPMT